MRARERLYVLLGAIQQKSGTRNEGGLLSFATVTVPLGDRMHMASQVANGAGGTGCSYEFAACLVAAAVDLKGEVAISSDYHARH